MPPARARGRARVFGYGVIMLIMLVGLYGVSNQKVIGIHDRLHDRHMIGRTPNKESFTEAKSSAFTARKVFERVTFAIVRLTGSGPSMTASDLAKLWGCSRQAIQKAVKKGMPLTSEEDAARWKVANAIRAPRCKVSSLARQLPDPKGPVDLTNGHPAETHQVTEVRERWNRAKLGERIAHEQLMKARENGDVMQIRQFLHAVINTQQRARDAADEYRQAQASAGILIPRADHDQVVARLAAEFQKGLEGIVSQASKLAGQGPEQIHQFLRECTGRIYESIKARMIA